MIVPSMVVEGQCRTGGISDTLSANVSVRLLNTLSTTCRVSRGSAYGGEGRACGGEGRACGREGPRSGGEGGQSLTSNRAVRWVGGVGLHFAGIIDADWQGMTRIDQH